MSILRGLYTTLAVATIKLISIGGVASMTLLMRIAKKNIDNTRIQDEATLAYEQIRHLEREVAIKRSESDGESPVSPL